jgi:ABC-type Mn2+/Zn2+ transport system ATPase subunit
MRLKEINGMNTPPLVTTEPAVPRRHPGHIPGEPILRVQHLSVSYESGRALEDVSFELITGERVAVVGPNGAGKSTLFKVIAGLMKPDNGKVSVFGAEPSGHICISYLPQHSHVDWHFPVTVSDVVLMGLTGKIGYLRWASAKDREIVKYALNTVGLGSFSGRQISQLSGGQQQRMFIARALAQEADLMLMDEPVTGLDTPSQEELFTVLDSLKSEKVTVMFALHDLKLAASSFDRVMLLNHRLVGIGKPQDVFTKEQLKAAYGDRIQILEANHDIAVVDDTCCGEVEE